MTSTPQERTAAPNLPAGPPLAGTAAVQPGPAPALTPRRASEAGPGPDLPAQMWMLEIPPGTVLRTSNDRLYRLKAAAVNKDLRALAQQLARAANVPRVGRADIFLTYIPPPRLARDRHPLASARVEDAGALAPTGKALIDGLKDAGVLADDNYRHVRREIYQLLEGTCPRGQLRLHIIEVPS